MANKKPTKLDLLLSILSDHEWHWGNELATRVTWRFGATIKQARDLGYLIETDHVGRDHCYRLIQS
jgi:hypothetical protein